ncbi:polysaccharide biosynthesis protein [Bacillus pseudomycoides]|nr:polysaccharide biosynthesis protein [Bacillus pseudomycoides]
MIIKKMERESWMEKNSLLKKFMEYALGSGIVLVLGFISSPLNTRLFTPSEYGKYSMFLLIANVINAIILVGLDQSFVRFFHEEESKSRGKLLYATLKIPIIMCLVVCSGIIIFYKSFSYVVFEAYSIQLLVLIVLNNFFMLFNRFSLLVIRMQQKGKMYSLMQIVQKTSNIILIVLFFIPLKNNFLALVYAFVISNMIVTIFAIYVEKEFWGFSQVRGKLKTSNSELIKFGIPLVFTFLITWLFQSIDRIFIQYFNDYNELGLYSAAFSIIALLNAVQSAFTMFWVPVAYEAYSKNESNVYFFEKINKIVTYLMFLIGILMIAFKDVIVFILGQDFREASAIMPFLVFMPLMYTISETTVLGISFKKKSNYHVIIAFSAALVNIVGNLVLVPSFGAKGAAISTGLSYIIFFSMRTLISRYLYRVNYSLMKFYIMTTSLAAFAIYATFNTFDIFYMIFLVFNLFILHILYKNVWLEYLLKGLKKNN